MATYHTKHNAGGGGVGSYADPWTLQEAADNAVAGDVVKIHNTGTYTPGATVDFDTNNGSATQVIQFIGVGSGEAADPELVTVDFTAQGNIDGFDIDGRSWLYFENIKAVLSSNQDGWQIVTNASDHVTWVNCKVTGANDGWRLYATSVISHTLIGCESYGNARFGIYIAANVYAFLWGCVVHDNANAGITLINGHGTIGRCVAYDNGAAGISINQGVNQQVAVVGCTSVDNTGSGIYLAANADAETHLMNNISVRNGAYGADTDTAGRDLLCFGNLWPSSGDDANTSGATHNVDVLGNPADILKANLTGSEIADLVDLADMDYPDLRLDTNSDALSAAWPGQFPITDMSP